MSKIMIMTTTTTMLMLETTLSASVEDFELQISSLAT